MTINEKYCANEAALWKICNQPRIFQHMMFNTEVFQMNNIQKFAVNAATTILLFGLGGCAGMSAQDKNTAIGAGVGAVGGSILTGGGAIGTVGGAAVGGVIGNKVKP